MVTNADAIVYNEHNGSFYPTPIGRVMWQDNSAVNAAGKQYDFHAPPDTLVFIPRETIDSAPGEYINPYDYAALTDPAGYWTVTPGHDYISRGSKQYDVANEEHSNIKTITAAAFNDFGSYPMQHIEVAAL